MNEKQRMLKYILTHLGDNFCGSGIDSYGRAYAFTDSEIAANSLEETQRIHKNANCRYSDKRDYLDIVYELIKEGMLKSSFYKR